ncbi:hypothetical protein PLICRDRAFT_617223 [Plicaturopsis crispa FD-325 SS-3]|nr:hypothetical protein PLICRDRAFT_617223 [Plicaturopsis crispa FD-325 SS-3]
MFSAPRVNAGAPSPPFVADKHASDFVYRDIMDGISAAISCVQQEGHTACVSPFAGHLIIRHQHNTLSAMIDAVHVRTATTARDALQESQSVSFELHPPMLIHVLTRTNSPVSPFFLRLQGVIAVIRWPCVSPRAFIPRKSAYVTANCGTDVRLGRSSLLCCASVSPDAS